jgi:hypothetical protein
MLTQGQGQCRAVDDQWSISTSDNLIHVNKMLFLAMSITEDFRAYYTNKSDCRVVEYIHVGLFWREDFR